MKSRFRLLLPIALLALTAPLIPAADISVTAANVLASASAITKPGVAGVAITAGQVLYFDTASTTWKLARANSLSTVPGGTRMGLALNNAAIGQPIIVLKSDPAFASGAGSPPAKGILLVVSAAAAGASAPFGDLTTGGFPFVYAIVNNGGTWRVDFDHALQNGSANP